MKSTLSLWMYISQGAKGIIKNFASFVVFSLSTPMLQCSAILISSCSSFSPQICPSLFFLLQQLQRDRVVVCSSVFCALCVCVCEGDKVQNQSKCVQRLSSHQDCQDEMNNLLLTHSHTHTHTVTIQQRTWASNNTLFQ